MNEEDLNNVVRTVVENLNNLVFAKIYDKLSINPELRKVLNPAFPYPNTIRIGILKNKFVIEYCGPENQKDNSFNVEGMYKPNYDIYDFLGVELLDENIIRFPVVGDLENITMFTYEAASGLFQYMYDIPSSPSEIISFNSLFDFNKIEKPVNISNTTIFYADKNGDFKIKRIDFMQIIPIENDEIKFLDEKGYNEFAKYILNNSFPQYDIEAHQQLNEFIELINKKDVLEIEITKYLEENPLILQLAFGVDELNPQVDLIWQYETDMENLKPDFLPMKMDGYCDIMEFKLPKIKNKPKVGNKTRSHPSYEVDSYISQVECYNKWFSQDINRIWIEKEKGVKIHNPSRYLVIGHSSEFSSEYRREIRGIRDIIIYTYDEFIEMARYQIYRVK